MKSATFRVAAISCCAVFVSVNGSDPVLCAPSVADVEEALGTLAQQVQTQNWRGIIVEKRIASPPGQRPDERSRRIEFCFRDGQKKFDIRGIPYRDAETAYGVNSRYAFEIDRDPGQKGYYVSDYYRGTTGTTHVFIGLSSYQALPFASLMLNDALLTEILPQCDVEQVADKPDGQTVLTFKRPDGSASYRAVLDRKIGYAIVEWEVVYPEYKVRQENAFTVLETGVPYPTEINKSFSLPNGEVVDRFTWTFETPSVCEAPDDQFTLTAYGLPEIDTGPGFGDYARVAFIAINVVFVLGVAYLLWRRLRARA